MSRRYRWRSPRAGTLALWVLSVGILLLVAPAAAMADDPILPNPALTPGAVLTTDVQAICRNGYSKSVRHTSSKLKSSIYRKYGINRHDGHYEIDHLIPLGIGGADVAENLWPQSYDTHPWNAAVKDRLEWKLHELVCSGDLDVREAQRAVAKDWIEAYKRFCATERDCPSYAESRGGD